jgi:hypothetical protein
MSGPIKQQRTRAVGSATYRARSENRLCNSLNFAGNRSIVNVNVNGAQAVTENARRQRTFRYSFNDGSGQLLPGAFMPSVPAWTLSARVDSDWPVTIAPQLRTQ